MFSFSRTSRGRAAGLLLLALATLAAASAPTRAEAQRDREDVFLSDRPAPRRGCRASPHPGQLPALAALVDSAALHEGLGPIAAGGGVGDRDTVFVLLSVSFDAAGAAERVRPIQFYAPAAVPEAVQALVAGALRTQPGSGHLRVRVHPGSGRVLVGRSEICLPDGPDEVTVERFAASAGRAERPSPATLRMVVSAEGRSVGARILRGSGNSSLDEYALNMVGRRRFSPGLVDGIPTEMEHDHTVRFIAR